MNKSMQAASSFPTEGTKAALTLGPASPRTSAPPPAKDGSQQPPDQSNHNENPQQVNNPAKGLAQQNQGKPDEKDHQSNPQEAMSHRIYPLSIVGDHISDHAMNISSPSCTQRT
jgi:hypothetical protein